MTVYVTGTFHPERMRIKWVCPFCGYQRHTQITVLYRDMRIYVSCEKCGKSFMVCVDTRGRTE